MSHRSDEICETCSHFRVQEFAPLGKCSRWNYGYGYVPSDLPFNEVLVEDDEGWGSLMGPQFGCLLHEQRRP